jgi:hypothetical protein
MQDSPVIRIPRLPPQPKQRNLQMSRLSVNVWVRALSIGLALSVPAVVMAARVQFNATDVLTLEKLNGVANRTVDKASVYSNPATVAVADGAAADIAASCNDPTDVLLNCSCDGNGSRQQVLHFLRVSNNDEASAPNALATCTCSVVGSGAAATRAIATCLSLP